MNLEWPQITWICLTLIWVGINLGKDGEPGPKFGFVRSLLNAVIVAALLYAGGFFGRVH